ncbi:uncharacterized protein LOC141639820 isoform X2 [Silene latifolia]|uniref:uncharacterized protein LOC141639820 isoform X2 n=1 Tax=Silene latifolia TaxID=37657 RepID=UPI003D7754CC
MIDIEEDVMGFGFIIYMDGESLCQFLDLDELDAMHIGIWMKSLCTHMAERNYVSHDYGFVSPKLFSHKSFGYTYKEYNERIVERLMTPKSLWFAPYNENRKYWLLMTNSVQKGIVYWIDSCGHSPTERFVKMMTDVFQTIGASSQTFVTINAETTAPFSVVGPCGKLSLESISAYPHRSHLQSTTNT